MHEDQASSLRKQAQSVIGASEQKASNKNKALRCIAIASGKGGVGKSFFSINLAIALAKRGSRTLLFDSDLSLANVDILLGMSPSHTIQDFIFNGTPLSSIVQQSPLGIDFIAAASGEKNMVDIGNLRLQELVKDLVSFSSSYDSLLFDCGAGLSHQVTSFIAAAPSTIIILTPDPTSIMDGYALIKLIISENLNQDISIVINMAESESQAQSIYKTILRLTENFLFSKIKLLGIIPRSTLIHQSTLRRKPLMQLQPNCPAAAALNSMASCLLNEKGGKLNADALLQGLSGSGEK